MNRALGAAIALAFILGFPRPIFAVTVTISENGSGSTSTVTVRTNRIVSVFQENFRSVFTKIFNSANTGGNSTDGGSNTTGNINQTTTVTVNGNTNEAQIPCCDGEVPPAVPEFGLVTGALSLLSSGSFYFLRKRITSNR